MKLSYLTLNDRGVTNWEEWWLRSFWLCVSVYEHWHAMGHNFVKSSLLVPWAARKRGQWEKWLLEEEEREKIKGVTEWRTNSLWYLLGRQLAAQRKINPSLSLEEGYALSNWKQAPVKQITSHKPKIIRWDRDAKEWKQECETVKEMNISRDGGFYLAWQGLKVNLHQQSHLPVELWLRREGEEEGQQTRKIKAR